MATMSGNNDWMTEPRLAALNLNLLVHLDALLQERHVTSAARREGVTQSAMSHSLAKLRAQLDDPLLVRRGRRNELTPRAAALERPLRATLLDLQRLLARRGRFDPRSIERTFALACPDFLSVLVLPAVLETLARRAPGVSLEVVPAARPRYAELLASGELDFALGAVLSPGPGVQRATLYHERFVGLVRKGHPAARSLTIERYARLGHALITIGETSGPTWVDDQLRLRGLSRRIVLRTRSFLAAPLLVAQTDLVLTAPERLCRYLAQRYPLVLVDVPVELPEYDEELLWHERFDEDPAHRWLRGVFEEAGAGLSSPRRSRRGRG